MTNFQISLPLPPTFHVTCMTEKYFFKLIRRMTKAKNEKICLKRFLKKTTKQRNSRIEEKVKADKMKDTDFITFPD